MYKLLIVDDEPLVQVGIKSMLDWASLNIEIIGTAANGEAALKIIEDQMPDIVITDIKMPILSGLELDANMLGESVRKAIQLVDETKTPGERETAFSPAGLLQERFFIRLINNLFENEDEFKLQKEELSISFSDDGCLAGYFLIDTPAETTMDSTQLLNLYSAALHMFIQLIAKYVTCYVTPLDAYTVRRTV